MTPIAAMSAAIVWAMVKLGPIDRPNERSSHVRPVPKGGGLGPVIVFVAMIGIVAWNMPNPRLWPGMLGGGLIVAIMALLDDVYDLPFTIKLAAQCAAAALVVASGVFVSQVGPVLLGVFGPVLTFCWIVYATNAVNFMDGLNGLAAGTCAIAGLALGVATTPSGDVPGIVLAAGLLGFLPFNFPRARIFLGDVGSQFCGFTLAVIAVLEAQQASPAWLVVPLALLVLLFDVAVTLLRRWRAGERLTQAHRGHCYQLLHRSGVPAPWVTASVWALAAWGAACAVWTPWYTAIPLAFAPLLVWTGWAWHRARARLETW